MKALLFTLRLLEPALFTQVNLGDPNSASTHSYVPGSMLRGWLARRYLGGKTVDAADPDFRRLFLGGEVRYLNAYPCTGTGGRSLPTPHSFLREKDTQEPIWDLALRAAPPGIQIKGLDAPFVALGGQSSSPKVALITPKRQVAVHIARQESAIFRYESLVAGSRFAGAILASQDSDLHTLCSLLRGADLALGASLTAAYGRAVVEMCDVQEDWCESQPVGEPVPDKIIVTCLSDTLVRNPQTGAYASDLDATLGCQHDEAFAHIRIVGGFSVRWGLPLPQSGAIAAGSVFVYPHSAALETNLRSLEASGIGERLAEGYGRIAVNWHTSRETWTLRPQEPELRPLAARLPSGSESAILAERMAVRMWRTELDRLLAQAINATPIGRVDQIQNAQISRARLAVRNALSERQMGPLISLVENLKSAARTQFERSTVGSLSLREWLLDLARKPEKVWGELRTSGREPCMVGGIGPTQDDPVLAREYALRLIDGVLQVAIRKRTQEGTR